MSKIKLLGMTVVALVVSAGIASSVALAAPEFVLLAGEAFPVAVTAEGGVSVHETTSGKRITCQKNRAEGTLKDSQKAELTVQFSECKEGALGCKSLMGATKDAKEVVLIVAAKARLVSTKSGAALGGGLSIAIPATLELECGVALVQAKGFVIGKWEKVTTEAGVNEDLTTDVLKFKQAKGEQTEVAYSECAEEAAFCAEAKANILELNFSGFFELAGLEEKEEKVKLATGRMVTIKV